MTGWLQRTIGWFAKRMAESRIASEPWPDPEIPSFDENGIMVPPWVKYPNLSRESMGWRMGQGETYMDEFRAWFYGKNSRQQRVKIMNIYPATDNWEGFYKS